MTEGPERPVRRRYDGTAVSYLAVAAMTILITSCAVVFTPERIHDGQARPSYFAGMAIFATCGVYVLFAGRLGPRAVHAVASASVLAGSLIVLGFSDPVTRAVTASGNLVIVFYLCGAMSRRVVAAYALLCTAVAVLLVATLPAEPLVLALRLISTAAVLLLPVVSFLMLRGQLDEALRVARELATRDTLTGLLNRRGLQDAFPVMASLSARETQAVAVLVCDLDHFKKVNDTLGHAAGDDVLRQVGETLRAKVRDGDILVRLGGEEIAVVAAVHDVFGATDLAERLRAAVEQDCRRWSATMSVGVAVGHLDRAADYQPALEALLAEADGRLYEAKLAGRNRVAAPLPTPHPAPPR